MLRSVRLGTSLSRPACAWRCAQLEGRRETSNNAGCLCRLGERVGVPVYDLGKDASPVEVATKGVAKAADEGFDAVIVDTAGRLQVRHVVLCHLCLPSTWLASCRMAAPSELGTHKAACSSHAATPGARTCISSHIKAGVAPEGGRGTRLSPPQTPES